MNILGIHYGHNATIALVQNGKLTFAVSEERFNRLKNSKGFPVLTLDYIYKNILKPREVDLAVLFQKDYLGYLDLKRNNFKSIRDFSLGNDSFNRCYSFKNQLIERTGAYKIRSLVGRILNRWRRNIDKRSQESINYFSKSLQIPREKIIYSDHHASHAYATCFNLNPAQKTLIFTMDGEGDGLSSTVNIFHNYKMKRISSNPIPVSLGYFYAEITKLLGMIPNEHEFKVMGLAPYAKQEKAQALYERFKDLITLNSRLEFEAKLPMNRISYYLLEKLYNQRFDTIAAFAQLFLEEKVLEWVKAWIKKTAIHDLALAGGVFMNVKLNQKILELKEVNSLFPVPSAGDESTALGAACYGYIKLCQDKKKKLELQPVKDLYLGTSYSNNEVEKFLSENRYFGKYKIEKFSEKLAIEKKIAQLLAENQIVARFKGRMEWGARALGNRSILANPRDRNTVREINERIKNRDFWMPFAPSILEEDAQHYLVNPKNIFAPYMAITFDTTDLAREHLVAAIHPYDFTSRPQIVSKDWNPSYYYLISEFKKLTGIGGVLNTSFNLHGEPNVEGLKDAFYTFENSGLKYLAVENFLVLRK